MDTLRRQRYHLILNRQRYKVSRRVLFHFISYSLIWHVKMDELFTQRIMHHQLYVSLTLDAQELWALDEQLKLSADMLARILAMDSGLHIPNNPNALRNL